MNEGTRTVEAARGKMNQENTLCLFTVQLCESRRWRDGGKRPDAVIDYSALKRTIGFVTSMLLAFISSDVSEIVSLAPFDLGVIV